jgi:hypothetical protein
MVVDRESANWRLFGGGGLLVGGLLWLIGAAVYFSGLASLATWIQVIGVLVVGVGLFLVAFGQTGSNGAVGAGVFGKAALVAFGIGWLIVGLLRALAAAGVAAPVALGTIAVVLVVVGGIHSAVAIYRRGVARGAARWILALPVAWGIVWALHQLGWAAFLADAVISIVLGALYAVAGLLYLLNSRSIG